MSDVVDLLRQIVRAELSRHLPSHIGVVETVNYHADPADSENYSCDVRLRGRDLVLAGVPLVTNHLGTVGAPVVGDVVLVHFVEGNSDQPIIGGRLYSDQLRPPIYAAGEIVTNLPPGAPDTDRIDLTLKGGQAGSRSMTIKLPADVTLAVTDNKVEVTVGTLKLTIDKEAALITLATSSATVSMTDKGAVTISADGDLAISSKGNVTIKADGALTLQATGNAILKGSVVQIN